MSNLLNYLKYEGLIATVKRAWNKLFHHVESHTIFLLARGAPQLNSEMEMELEIELVTNENKAAFEQIKFWDFVKADGFIGNPRRSVIMLKDGRDYIAYAAEEHEEERKIFGLGSFVLNSGQGWIGPVYVLRIHRGKGYNRFMLIEQMKRLQRIGVNEIFTAINSQNTASLNSFKNVGFEEIGKVDAKGQIIYEINGILSGQFKQNITVRTTPRAVKGEIS